MKQVKGFICGLLIGSVGVTSVLAASGIKSVVFNSNKAFFNGNELNLSNQPMISVVREGETNASNYMPTRAILEQMGYIVEWDENSKAVLIKSKDYLIETSGQTDNSQKLQLLYYSGYEGIVPDFLNIDKNNFEYSVLEGEGGLWHSYKSPNVDNDFANQKFREYTDLLLENGFISDGKQENPAMPTLHYYTKGDITVMLSITGGGQFGYYIQICIVG